VALQWNCVNFDFKEISNFKLIDFFQRAVKCFENENPTNLYNIGVFGFDEPLVDFGQIDYFDNIVFE